VPLASPSATAISPSPNGSGLPAFSAVWIVVLENTDYGTVVRGSGHPYLRSLIEHGALAESYTGVGRPSQPNYLALFSGSIQGVRDNDDHDLSAPTIADQLEASGRTWREHAENVPSSCFKGSVAKGGRDGAGEYRRKHAPAISFTAISREPDRCRSIQDLSAFQPGDSDYALIIPNQCHAAHDCPLSDADTWLAGFVPRILDSAAYRAGGVLFVTFDEDAGDSPGGGHVATIVLSPHVRPGTSSRTPYDHYSLLRTIEDAWGLDCLAKACDAKPMLDLFVAP
jgi:acid phosphatase